MAVLNRWLRCAGHSRSTRTARIRYSRDEALSVVFAKLLFQGWLHSRGYHVAPARPRNCSTHHRGRLLLVTMIQPGAGIGCEASGPFQKREFSVVTP